MIRLVSTLPGMVTFYWSHPDEEFERILIEREAPPQVWHTLSPEGSDNDLNLEPDTPYRYRACAEYEDSLECSEWQSVKTRPPEQPRGEHPKPPPAITHGEAYHEPPVIRLWWRKTGDYERVIVRWNREGGAARQEDIDTRAREGQYDVPVPLPGRYVFLLKGCTINFVGVANCGAWSAPFTVDTAQPGVARVDCQPGTLGRGSPRFAADGRADYEFIAQIPGYNTPAGICVTADRIVVAEYVVHGVWNPRARPGAWDGSGANAMETITLTFSDAFSPERAPRRPDAPNAAATISFLARAQCDRDPWLNADATCRRTANNIPEDIRAKWPDLLRAPFPHTGSAIAADERERLLARYRLLTAEVVGPAESPTRTNLETATEAAEREAPARGGESALQQATDHGVIAVGGDRAAPATAGATATRSGSSAPVAADPQTLSTANSAVLPRSGTEINAAPSPPLPSDARREGELHEAPAATPAGDVIRGDGITRAVPRGETPLQTSPLGVTGRAARAAEDIEILTEDLLCQGGPLLRFENHGRDPETGSERMRLYFGMPKTTAADRRPAAGADGVWLDPGTCAFANREWIPGDPPGVQFEVVQGASGGSGPVSIPEYLRDESQYWRFAVYRTAYGYYQATRHESWRPAASPAGSELDEWRTPVHGGPGGVPFEDACESGSYLAGIEARVGRDVDAVAPVCARLRPDGSRGAVVTGSLHGGSGGDHQRLVCPERYPFVRTLRVDWEGQETLVLDMIGFACGPMRGPLPRRVPGFNYLAASGPPAVAKSDFIFVSEDVPRGHASVDCPDGFAYAGLHGRAYAMVDALGAICREIPATPR